MQRKTGIVIGVCAALVLAGSAGAAAWRYSTGGPQIVGSWHDAPDPARSPVPDGRPRPRAKKPESVPAAAPTGRQRVGRVQAVDQPITTGKTWHYPGASYVKLHFGRLTLGPDDYLTVANPDGSETYRYDATTADKWAMSITGDTALLSVHKAPGSTGSDVDVDRVAKGYTPVEQAASPESTLLDPARTGREESVCGGDESADAACYKSADPVAFTRSRAVARLLINGTELCTAWRLGPKDRLITNNHCFSKSKDAYNTEVWFNYQCAKCGGAVNLKPTKVWGAQVLATNHVYDYTLFTVANFRSIQKYGYLSFDTRRPARGDELYIPQHPAGEPTKIAGALGEKAGTCAVASPGYAGYAKNSDVAYFCDTEGGSSGSPVLSRKTDKVVALHHFGGCPNSGVRGDILYAKLKSLL